MVVGCVAAVVVASSAVGVVTIPVEIGGRAVGAVRVSRQLHPSPDSPSPDWSPSSRSRSESGMQTCPSSHPGSQRPVFGVHGGGQRDVVQLKRLAREVLELQRVEPVLPIHLGRRILLDERDFEPLSRLEHRN